MKELLEELRTHFEGEISTDIRTLERYSTDASLYQITPSAVLFPKTSRDIRHLVTFIGEHKALYPQLSLTARGAGTCMSGGPLNDSFIIDTTRHLSSIVGFDGTAITVQPGVFMRDIDAFLAPYNRTIGAAPASRALCTIGGMVANNSGGELSLQYGNIAKSVIGITAILADGKEYLIKPVSKKELSYIIKEGGFLADVYKELLSMTNRHKETIRHLRPRVHKNSTGYNLWDFYDDTTKKYDLTQLFCGSQGTLGIITSIKLKTVPQPQHTGMLLAYVSQPKKLGQVIRTVSQHQPLTFEGFDDITFKLGIKYFSQFKKQVGLRAWAREEAALMRTVLSLKHRIPNIVLMIEFDGKDTKDTAMKLLQLEKTLRQQKIKTTIIDDETSDSFWRIRRASLALLREKVKDKYAAPFIDDLAVEPRFIPEFLPQLQKIIRRYKLPATIAGHFGDGNFHIIPLIDMANSKETAKLEPVMREIVPLVQQYGGTLAGEHNDGLVRGPWLAAMYGEVGYELFRDTKQIFDPMNIFNPHKKTDATWQASMSYLRTNDSSDDLIVLKNT